MRRSCCLVIVSCFIFTNVLKAQEESTPIQELEKRISILESKLEKKNKFKLSGYLQTQLDIVEKEGISKEGNTTSLHKWDHKDFFIRTGIRRGRLKFQFTEGMAVSVFQLDLTEGGIKVKDAYIGLIPQTSWIGGIIGIQDRPFGDDIVYSSSKLETMERSIITQNLFDNERDLGAMIIIVAPPKSKWYGLTFQGGLFNGNGIARDDDGRYDFIGHLHYKRSFENTSFGIGVSLYDGHIYNLTYDNQKDAAGNTINPGKAEVYKVKEGQWQVEQNSDKFNRRVYYGVDAQYTFKTRMGLTNLRAEYLFGEQPSEKLNFMSSVKNLATVNQMNYIRSFRGGHLYYIQELFKSPVSAVLRYAYIDPNTKMDNKETSTSADVTYQTIGFGGLWQISKALSLRAYYEFLINEKCASVSGYEDNRKDNTFAIRLQYKF